MKRQITHSGFLNVVATAIVAVQLVACGGGGGSSGGGAGGQNSISATGADTSISKSASSAASATVTSDQSIAPEVKTGILQLSWTAPVTRTDGTPLSLADISGFRIYYGKSAGNYEHTVNVSDGTAQAARVKNIPVGTYHVVMTTYDNNGRESGYSAKVSKTVL